MLTTEFVSTFIALFVIIDPIGSVPVFIALTPSYSEENRRKVARKAVLVAGGVLLFFIMVGKLLFDFLGVRLASFEIAGGIVLFLFALKMIFDKPEGFGMPGESEHDVAVFPLAIPSIAGPGAMLGVMVAATSPAYTITQQLTAASILIIVLACTYLCLRGSNFIHRWIGNTGALILSRVMGILLAAIAIETLLKALVKIQWIQS